MLGKIEIMGNIKQTQGAGQKDLNSLKDQIGEMKEALMLMKVTKPFPEALEVISSHPPGAHTQESEISTLLQPVHVTQSTKPWT